MNGDELRAFRKSRRWTQVQLAAFLTDSLEQSYTDSAIRKWESGQRKTPETVSAFLGAVALDDSFATFTPDDAAAGPHDGPHDGGDSVPPQPKDLPSATPPIGVSGVYSKVCTELWEVIATGVGMTGALLGSDAMIRDATIIDADKQALGHAYGKLAETNDTFRRILTGMVESGAWLEVGLVTAGTAGKLWRNHAVVPPAPSSSSNGAADPVLLADSAGGGSGYEQPAPTTA